MKSFFLFGELGIIHKKKRSFCNFTALNNGNGKFIIKRLYDALTVSVMMGTCWGRQHPVMHFSYMS